MPARRATPSPTAKPRARPYAGKSREQRRAERHEQLLDAAKTVFGTLGFHAATVKGICVEAGLTERYFYESFRNLNALFSAVYDRELDALRERLVGALMSANQDVNVMAEAAMRAYYGSLKADPLAARILIIEVYGTTHDMDRLYRRGVHDFAELIRGVITQQFELDKDDPLDPGLLSTALVGAAIHLAMRWQLGGYQESVDVMVRNTLAIITALNDRLAAGSVGRA